MALLFVSIKLFFLFFPDKLNLSFINGLLFLKGGAFLFSGLFFEIFNLFGFSLVLILSILFSSSFVSSLIIVFILLFLILLLFKLKFICILFWIFVLDCSSVFTYLNFFETFIPLNLNMFKIEGDLYFSSIKSSSPSFPSNKYFNFFNASAISIISFLIIK